MQNLYYFTSIIIKGKKFYAPILIFDDQYSLEKLRKNRDVIFLKNLKLKSLSFLKIKQELFININYNKFNNIIIKNKGNKIFYKFLIFKESYCKIFSNRLKKIQHLLNFQHLYLSNFSKINFNINIYINKIYFT